MSSKSFLRVRLTPSEMNHLQVLAKRSNLNCSELIRLLLLREWKRRTTGQSAVLSSEYLTDARTGRRRAADGGGAKPLVFGTPSAAQGGDSPRLDVIA